MPQTDEFGKHEVLHTSSIVMQMFDDYLLSHGAVEADPEIKEAAQRAFDSLFEFYQLCGRKFP